jgi:hypothetical protein
MAKDLHQAPESLFWYWINERHRIYLKRAAGEPKPWTDDPILRDYKFTNVFRQLDRGTVWLTENFLVPHADDRLELLAFNICWYRMFNFWKTGAALGWQTSWDAEDHKRRLTIWAEKGNQVFTNAHIIYSPPGKPKIDAIVDVCSDLYHMCLAAGALVTCAREEKRLQTVFEGLTEVDCVGGFMAYEMVSDMRHTRLLSDAHDIMMWANMGPGAQRGLRRLGLPAKNQKEGVSSMRDLLNTSNMVRPEFLTNVPQMEMRDIEHSLCEFDKYCRVKFGEGEPRMKFNGRS